MSVHDMIITTSCLLPLIIILIQLLSHRAMTIKPLDSLSVYRTMIPGSSLSIKLLMMMINLFFLAIISCLSLVHGYHL